MLSQQLIEAENAYRRPFNLEEENLLPEEKLIDRENWEEHYVRKGDPSKPTYYIIRRNFVKNGLFSIFTVYTGHIRYALSKGWLPVVDMQNYPNAYLEPEKLGKENAWEYYFEQPLSIGLEEAYSGENIVLSGGNDTILIPWSTDIIGNKIVLAEWQMMVKLGLLKVKPEIAQEAQEDWKKLFAPTDRVLGVILRGTDFVALKPKGHPIPPPLNMPLIQ